MTERKPAGWSWESFAEHKIREAAQEGAFNGLPGLGKPIPGIDDPPDPNWWVKQKLRDEGLSVLPPTLEARLAVEKMMETLWSLPTETAVRRRLEALNEQIRKAHFSTAPGPPDGVLPVDIEALIDLWRTRRHERSASARPDAEVSRG